MEPWRDRLAIGFQLDRRWHWLRGQMQDSKAQALEQLTRVLEQAGIEYAIIGGIAVQLYLLEPRTTLDIDVAVRTRSRLPADDLAAEGFTQTGDFEHSQNWRASDGTPVQFADDPELGDAITNSVLYEAGPFSFRVAARADLLAAKLRAASDPARRRSKRLMDLADVQGMIEQAPELEGLLTTEQRDLLDRLG